MATIYGEKKRGRKKLVIFVAVLAAAAIVVSAYYATRPEPEEVVARYSEDMLGALDILSIEYGEAVRNGAVVEESEYKGARLILDRIFEKYAKMKPYAMQINPEVSRNIDKDLNRLKSKFDKKAPPDEVDQIIETISKNLRTYRSEAK